MHTEFQYGNPNGRNLLEGLGISGWIIRFLERIRTDVEVGCEAVHWIHMIQDRDHWRIFVEKVMNIRVPYNAVDFLAS